MAGVRDKLAIGTRWRILALGAMAAILLTIAVGDAQAKPRKADLVVKSVGKAPGPLAIGNAFRLKTTVQNKGRAKAGRSALGYYLSFDRVRSSDDFRLKGRGSAKALKPRRKVSSRPRLKPPASSPLESLYVIACADAKGRVREKNEANNCRAVGRSSQVLPPITTLDLIERARRKGELLLNEAMLMKMRAITGYPKLPERFRAASPGGGIDGVARSVIAEIAANSGSLSLATKLALDAYMRPPIYEGAAVTGGGGARANALRRAGPSCYRGDDYAGTSPDLDDESWDSIDTEHFRFWHYTENLDPPGDTGPILNSDPEASLRAAQNMAAVAEHVYDQETTLFAREPLSDSAVACDSGDGRIDVFAARLTLSGTGAQVVPFSPGFILRPGWMHVRPDFVADPTDARDVFSHEFAHLVQLAFDYDDVPNRLFDYGWLEEASANWAIDYVYPEDDYEHRFGEDYLWRQGFSSPINFARGAPEGSTPKAGGNGYEDYLFFFYVTRRFNPLIMREVWSNTESMNSVDAVDDAIPGGFLQRWPEFARYNLNRGELDHYRAWDGFKPGFKLDGTTQPNLKVELKGTKARQTLPWPFPSQVMAYPLSTRYASFDLEDERVKKVTFRDFGFNDVGDPDEHDRVFAWWQLADGSTEVEEWTNESEVSFCRTNASEDIRKLVVLYTNSRSQDQIAGEDLTQTSFPELEGDTSRSKARVLVAKRCGYPERFTGTASGTMTDDSGRIQSWDATFTLPRDPIFDGSDGSGIVQYARQSGPEGTTSWTLSGTDDNGCTWSGGGQIDIFAELGLNDFDPDQSVYTFRLAKGEVVADEATKSCPGLAPSTNTWDPLLFAGGEMCFPEYPAGSYGSRTSLTGGTAYTDEESGTAIECSWQLSAG